MQLPAPGDKLVTHSANAIPETLFYTKILLSTAALISLFLSGIQAKGKVKNGEEAFSVCNELQVQTTLLCLSFCIQCLEEQN